MAAKSLTTETRIEPAKKWLLVGALALGLGGVMAYLVWPRFDNKAALDRQIADQWMQGREVVDALEFFEKGGVYESREGTEPPDIDQKYVVPLVKRLKEEHHLRVLAILDNPPEKIAGQSVPAPPVGAKTAMAIIAEVPPDDRALRNKVRATIIEEADKFPGFAMQNWSHKYVSLDYFDELEMTPLIQAGALEPLKASQRMME